MTLSNNASLKQVIDEFNNINTNLQTKKNNIASAITSKGVSASGTESFDSLKNKINSITLGKKWASGKIDAFSFNSSSYSVTVTTSLSFTPSMVIVSFPEVYTTYSTSTKYKANIVSSFNMGSGNKVIIPTYIRLHAYFDSISSSSFKFTVSNNTDYTVYFKGEITWYAYE